MRSPKHLAFFFAAVAIGLAACGGDTNSPAETTDFTSEVPTGSGTRGQTTVGVSGGTESAIPPSTTTDGKSTADTGATPGGRVADVQEADVYRIQGNTLFLLNTYRGFMVYDIADAKNPKKVSALPIYGYPVEMFVDKTTVYALLSDALYLTKVEGQLRFEKRNTSQIVAIDISNPAAPTLLQAYDLAGQLREGVSRKIEDTLYVVSYQPSGYWWYGWGPRGTDTLNEQAWVYSFSTANPASLQQVQKLKIFEGGQTNSYNETTGESHSRGSNGVALSATSNALMVVQNWSMSDYVPSVKDSETGDYGCGKSSYDQESVVSIVDISDPKGSISVAATFQTKGSLGDQFKQTYVYDTESKTGTYYGIFSRQVWGGSDCNWTSYTQNSVESWNIGGPDGTKRLSSIDIGKPNETVRGSTFDVDRKVMFAITAQRMDPMYAISFADRTNLKVLSLIDGLSGDMNLFRQIEGGKFLLAVGRDTGAACGTNAQETWNSQISVSLIDVRDLTKIRLAQRKCLDIKNAGWISSEVNWNLDQAHKMIGLYSDGGVNVLTVPVGYSVKNGENDWWWYRYETAVGIVSWDLSKYDDAKTAADQSLLTTHGAFVHPNGQVNRSVLFAREGTGQRSMLNISDTHLSFANIQDLNNPTLDAVVTLAENVTQVFRFGDYLVEQVQVSSDSDSDLVHDFRVKQLGGPLADAPVLAKVTAGGVQQVFRHGNLLAMLRQVMVQTTDKSSGMNAVNYTRSITVYDFTNPSKPVRGGTVNLPEGYLGYGWGCYYCMMEWWGGYYFGSSRSQLDIEGGIVFASQDLTTNMLTQGYVDAKGNWVSGTYSYTSKQWLTFLDLRDPKAPKLDRKQISLTPTSTFASDINLVADTVKPSGFYVSFRKTIGTRTEGDASFDVVKYQAQRFERSGDGWKTESAISLPGTLTRVFANDAGERLLVTREDKYTYAQVDGRWSYQDNLSLSLLRAIMVNGKPAAERLDTKAFSGHYPRSMVFEGQRLYLLLSASGGGYYYGGGIAVSPTGVRAHAPAEDTSDRLMIFDLSAGTFNAAYDQGTSLTNLDLMTAGKNRLFVNMQGDGILVVDVTNPAAPVAMSFYRTLGWPAGVELTDTQALVPGGYYGLYQMDLDLTTPL